ncbi:hypothetical protein FHS85_003291 [Rhodoligotrophos appendicifer]|uniref:outer membrane beta-barrel protein n=1 Tax=Rhodoligotrophos appendicifer TaxID=987056 RepID=UPI001184CB57|nr:outer membrane beta-barrel protein [Rhodoligotrophos appendicifer]
MAGGAVMSLKKHAAWLGGAVLAVVWAQPGHAQAVSSGVAGATQTRSASTVFNNTVVSKSPAESNAVRSRPQEDYDPIGGRVGSFFLYPWLEDAIIYDDNVYAEPHDKIGDGLNRVSGAVSAVSDFARHALNVSVAFDNYTYFNESRQNRTDVGGKANWRVDVTQDFNITGFANAVYDHEPPGSLEAPQNALEPVPFTNVEGGLSLNKRFNRLSGSLAGSAATISYDNVDAVGGGTLNQHYRDGQTYVAATRWAYEFSPGYAGFALVEGNVRDFDKDGYNRSSQGITGLGGVEFDITDLIHGELGFGYLVQDYKDGDLKDISDWTMRAAVLYNPTALLTLNLIAERRVGETIQTNASGRLDTLVRLVADYEMLRNLIFSPYLGFIHSNYEGSGRKDDLVTTGIKVDYLVNRNFSANIFYDFTDRSSNFSQYDYTRNYTGVGLRLQF